MSAVEEIEAAIERLGYLDQRWMVDHSNPLFDTLHRTIDAQLAILRDGLGAIAHWVDPNSEAGYESWDGEYPPIAEKTYLALARAINGTPS